MSLVTRCPRCRTLFRVTPNQLQAKSGRVRCGRCMNAFDAYDALEAETKNILAPPSAAVPADTDTPQAIDAAPAAPENELASEVERSPAAVSERASDNGEAAARAAAPASAKSPAPAMPPIASTSTVVAPTAAMASPPSPPPSAAAPPLSDLIAEPAPEERRGFSDVLTRPTPAQAWLGGAIALALLLVMQLAFAYRSEIVARSPFVRAALTSMCDHLGCKVALPQRPELLRIEASDVHMVDASRPQLIQLTATLRSYAGYDLAYPALDLVLTNANEHALARRIFTPDEYLDASRDPDAGIPANAEITVALDLDTADLNAAGFRLDLLAAPTR